MKTIVTYDKSSVSAKDDAVLYNALSNNNRLLTNMSISLKPSNVLSFDDGYMLISGRVIKFNNESINPNLNISDSNVKGFIILTIREESDILPENAVEISTSITSPVLKQDDINISGGIFQIIIGEYTANRTSVSSPKLILKNSVNFDLIYPIGAIYQSSVATSPEILFGGKWRKIDGKFLVAQGRDFGAAGSTGGRTSQQINVNHKHEVGERITNCKVESGTGVVSLTNYTGSMEGGNPSQTISTVPPFEVVYMWTRTA